MGMTPSFSPSMGSAKSVKASLISASSCAVMSCSLASLDCLAALPDAPDSAAPPDFRFGGCRWCQIDGWPRRKLMRGLFWAECWVLTMMGSRGASGACRMSQGYEM